MQFARTAGKSIGVAATVVAAGLLMALPASAHNRSLDVKCAPTGEAVFNLKLTQYSTRYDNTLKVTEGDTVLEDTTFRGDFRKEYKVPGDVTRTFKVELVAGDDNSKSTYSFKAEKSLKELCKQPEKPSTTPETPKSEVPPTEDSVPPSPTSSSSPAPSVTESAPVPSSQEVPFPSVTESTSPAPTTTTSAEVVPVTEDTEGLANTGASVAVPLGIGAALLAAGGGVLFFMRKRGAANNG
ncbi:MULTISPECIES: LPXTG cell wall anchor domain-containing protein [Actinosynnema]|uniref:LPXTG cell wall anchor domain-containing protein n=1 Tax=Actinosynnema TaxID=40566 RepID=UPI0020A5904D|nr:LPXTG cell wall anchor domain-containing protein [Actinosynnema pretiosum]MCP2098276.1 LPXTG-motif cell wall anchor domain-containing protein [Actinosynnema pretiosum]